MDGEIFIVPKWQAHEVKNFHELLVLNENNVKVLNIVSSTLINYMPLMGVCEINENSKRDLWLRLAMLQEMEGALIYFTPDKNLQNKIPLFLTEADVCRHIGLETEGRNVTFMEFCDACNKWLKMVPSVFSHTPSYFSNANKSMFDAVNYLRKEPGNFDAAAEPISLPNLKII